MKNISIIVLSLLGVVTAITHQEKQTLITSIDQQAWNEVFEALDETADEALDLDVEEQDPGLQDAALTQQEIRRAQADADDKQNDINQKRKDHYMEYVYNTYFQDREAEKDPANHYTFDEKEHKIRLKNEDVEKINKEGSRNHEMLVQQEKKQTQQDKQKRKELQERIIFDDDKIQEVRHKKQQFGKQQQGLLQSNSSSGSDVLEKVKSEVEKLSAEEEKDKQDLIKAQGELKNLTDVEQKKFNMTKKVVHLIPHSHTDEGWLSTVEDFYTGEDEWSIYIGCVRDILDSTIEELIANSNRTFAFAEIKYFQMWWERQTPEMQADVRVIVKNGQLDLVSGGWSAPDEAITTYDDILDNFMIGQRFLKREFGIIPRVSWQVDAFGASTGYARLMRDVGFDTMMFSRMDIEEKYYVRNHTRHLSVWRPHEENFGKQKDILSLVIDQGATLGSYCWPAGFWADTNYMIDAPIILDKKNPDYNFGKRVESFFYGMEGQFNKDQQIQHLMRPFGCDMAFVDANVNYRIMDELIKVWHEYGFDEFIDLRYSTPTRFTREIAKINEAHKLANDSFTWPIRRDDTLPYAQHPNQFWNGFYTSRPQLKLSVRELSRALQSSSRIISQQVLRRDLSVEKKDSIVQQLHFMYDVLGNLQHHDAITGTSVDRVSGDFRDKAINQRNKVLELNAKHFVEKLEQHHGVSIFPGSLDHSLNYQTTWTDLTSPFSHYDSYVFTIQNPSPQKREQMVELEVPYYNYTLYEIVDGKTIEFTNYDKLLPRTMLNSNRTVVKSYVMLHVKFENPHELSKAYLIKNHGVIREKQAPPANYTGTTEIWNLNLPVYLQKEGWEINNFQSNFKKVRKDRAMIKAGTKTLEFITIINSKKAKEIESIIDIDQTVNSTVVKQLKFDATDHLLKNGSLPKSLTEDKVEPGKKGGKGEGESKLTHSQLSDSVNITTNASSNSTEKKAPGAKGGKADQAKAGKGGKDSGKNSNNKTLVSQNEGAALFQFTDSETGLSQKFAFSLRHYWGAGGLSEKKIIHDGLYEFSVNGTSKTQRSFLYGQINRNKLRIRQNNKTGEFVLFFEKKVGNETIRASARIQMNEIDPFVKFDVELNEIPIKNDKIGKDIVVDWYFYDHFDTAGDIFVDANGLEMINKKINWRKEFTYNSNETISANYYPVTSAIAIRDKNESNFNKTGVKKQITILNDRSQGGSAGLRERRNIELMQHRRFKKSDYYGVFEPDNDLDKHGRGIQVLSSYYLMLNDHNKNGSSRQREIQKKIDQPFLTFYAKDYKFLPKHTSTLSKMNYTLAQSPQKLLNSSNSTNATNSTSKNLSNAAAPEKKSKKSEEETLVQRNASMAQNATGAVNSTNSTANKTKKPKLPLKPKPEDPANKAYKESKFIKTTTYPIGANEILVRITNLDDRFDGKTNEDYIYFDVNAFAREMYLEANEKNMSKSLKKQALVSLLKLEIEEMNIAGSIGLDYLNTSDHATKWKVDKKEDPPKNLIQKPKDKVHTVQLSQRVIADNPDKDPFEKVSVVALEPQRIRSFRIKYIMPTDKFEKKKPVRIVDQKNSTGGIVYFDEIPKKATATNQTKTSKPLATS